VASRRRLAGIGRSEPGVEFRVMHGRLHPSAMDGKLFRTTTQLFRRPFYPVGQQAGGEPQDIFRAQRIGACRQPVPEDLAHEPHAAVAVGCIGARRRVFQRQRPFVCRGAIRTGAADDTGRAERLGHVCHYSRDRRAGRVGDQLVETTGGDGAAVAAWACGPDAAATGHATASTTANAANPFRRPSRDSARRATPNPLGLFIVGTPSP